MSPTHPGLQYCDIHSEALQLPGCGKTRHSSSNNNNFAGLFSCQERILSISSGKNFTVCFFCFYNEETELTGQRLDPFVNTKVNQAVSFQVAVYPVDQHCITWKETMSSVRSLKLCFLDQERLKELNILLLYGASSCCSAVSMVSWILGLSSHSWSCIRVVKTKWL